MIQVKIFYAHNDLRNFSYLIMDNHSGESWVIDPFDEEPIINYIKKEGIVLQGILNTHQHWDHIKGNEGLKSHCNCSVLNKSTSPIDLDATHQIQFIDTPGHTSDHQAFCWKKNHQMIWLFSGDTLFNGGVGNCKNGGNVETLYETTMKLKEYPDHVVLYPGHDYILKNLLFAKTCEPENKDIDEALKLVRESDTEQGLEWTLGQEKKINPFLRLDSQEIAEKVMDDKKPLERDLFIKLRSMRDVW